MELLPVQYFVDERHLLDKGLRNSPGYSPIGYFAPDPRYAATDHPVNEFKSMVKALHSAGIEVLLDVVYNHTAEGNRLGPTLCFVGSTRSTTGWFPTSCCITWTTPVAGIA